MAEQYQLKTLADTMKASAFAINKRIQDEIGSLSEDAIESLSNESRDLLIACKTLYELTAIQIADEGQAALEKVEQATDKLKKAIKSIKTVQKVIDITAKVVMLAGTIISGNYLDIPEKVKGIIDELGEEDQTEDDA
ncbi:tryptophan 2,3-dioxygenase [Mucilaginibacter sp. UYP25]|uniref:hypothetical protein n=1 Tax=unclassified Mucilaginibacter TaxID=2617802 RepID=UPI0033975081